MTAEVRAAGKGRAVGKTGRKGRESTRRIKRKIKGTTERKNVRGVYASKIFNHCCRKVGRTAVSGRGPKSKRKPAKVRICQSLIKTK